MAMAPASGRRSITSTGCQADKAAHLFVRQSWRVRGSGHRSRCRRRSCRSLQREDATGSALQKVSERRQSGCRPARQRLTGLDERLPVSTSQRLALLERDAAGNVDIEQVDLRNHAWESISGVRRQPSVKHAPCGEQRRVCRLERTLVTSCTPCRQARVPG